MEMPQGEDALESEKPTETLGVELFLGTHLTHAGDEEGMRWDEARETRTLFNFVSPCLLFFWVYLDFTGRSIYQCIAWETKPGVLGNTVGDERRDGGTSQGGVCAGSFAVLGFLEDSSGSNSRWT